MKDAKLCGHTEVENPLNYKFVTQPMYREINIGYILDIPITVICISPNSKENIITFGIPLFGIWMINYNILLTSNLSLSCVKMSKLTFESEDFGEMFICNQLPNGTQCCCNLVGTFITKYTCREISLFFLYYCGKNSSMSITLSNGLFGNSLRLVRIG